MEIKSMRSWEERALCRDEVGDGCGWLIDRPLCQTEDPCVGNICLRSQMRQIA